MKLMVRDGETGELIPEDVQDERVLKLLYTTVVGRLATWAVFSRRWFSTVYSLSARSRFGRKSVPDFIERFGIVEADFEPATYRTFNDFFIRRLRDGARPFVADSDKLPAFAEARYTGWSSADEVPFFTVKRARYSVEALLVESRWAEVFRGGPVLIARLAPQDYHRFHIVDDGEILDHYELRGRYHSVNPIATGSQAGVFALNRRSVTVQQTRNFGRVAYVDVGAMTIGSIVAQRRIADQVRRGDERGYFQFGGSTVVMVGERGRWEPTETILESTREGVETYVRLGRVVGKSRGMRDPSPES